MKQLCSIALASCIGLSGAMPALAASNGSMMQQMEKLQHEWVGCGQAGPGQKAIH